MPEVWSITLTRVKCNITGADTDSPSDIPVGAASAVASEPQDKNDGSKRGRKSYAKQLY